MTHVVYIIANFETNQAYAGLTKQFTTRIAQHRKRKPHLFVGQHKIFTSRNMTAIDAQKKEMHAVRYLRLIGFIVVNVARPGVLGAPKERYWTKERCFAEALKYSTRREFELRASGAYDAARRYGWFDGISGHMIVIREPNGYWVKERCAQEAVKYTSRIEFRKKAPGAHYASQRDGWLDEVCTHMVRLRKPRSKDEAPNSDHSQ